MRSCDLAPTGQLPVYNDAMKPLLLLVLELLRHYIATVSALS